MPTSLPNMTQGLKWVYLQYRSKIVQASAALALLGTPEAPGDYPSLHLKERYFLGECPLELKLILISNYEYKELLGCSVSNNVLLDRLYNNCKVNLFEY